MRTKSNIITDSTIASQVIGALREDIVNKRIEAGSHITIKQVSERYGVSNMPVREAFRTLEGEGLLIIHPHKGAEVRRIDRDFVRDAYEVNRVLETLMFENAMERLDSEAFSELRQINRRISRLEDNHYDMMHYLELNYQLHEKIFEYNHNRKAYELFRYQNSLINSLRSAYVPSYARVQAAYMQHEKILDALEAKDRIALRDAAEEHVVSAMENFLRMYDK